MNWKNNTPPNASSKACSFCLTCFKTIGMCIFKNCIRGKKFLYQGSRRLNLLNIAPDFTSPRCCSALCPGLWRAVLGTNTVFLGFRCSLSIVSPFPLSSLSLWYACLSSSQFFSFLPLSISIYFLSFHLSIHQAFSHNTFISIFTPVLLSTTSTSFSSYFPCNKVCISPESTDLHKDHTPLLSRMPWKIRRVVIRLRSNTSANR